MPILPVSLPFIVFSYLPGEFVGRKEPPLGNFELPGTPSARTPFRHRFPLTFKLFQPHCNYVEELCRGTKARGTETSESPVARDMERGGDPIAAGA